MNETTPFSLHGAGRPGPWVITVDHATNYVPGWVANGDLGLPASDMNRHIAFDIGALGLALELGTLLDSPVVASNFSRLVIDPNRGQDDPTLVMKLYDGTIIPANHPLDAQAHQRRIDELYTPYHQQLARLMAERESPTLLAIHSFTPQLQNRPARPWQVGILFAEDTRLSHPLIEHLQGDGDLTVGVNEPYVGKLPGDSVDKHALQHGHLNALVEVRNDLIETPDTQAAWAKRLAPALTAALAKTKDH